MKTAKFLIAVALCSGPAFAQSPAIDIHVDAREAARHIYKAQLKVAVPPGPVTLLYPKWIPGEHGPTGPLANLVDLQIMAGSQRLTWQRDPLDMYRIQVVVPAGTDHLDIALSFVGGFSSEKLGVVSWNEVVLFPAGKPAPEISVKASLTLPNGWSGVGALDRTPAQGEIVLPQVDLATLIDSPILMGEYLSNLDLHPRSEGGVPGLPHALHVAGERAAAVTIPASFQETYTRLAEEAGALFGSRHYAHYDWLLSLTDMPRGFGGLEHHQSSDNIMPEDTLLEPALRQSLAGLLAHEFVHSWNGKYRRPLGLVSPDYQKPMDGSLLWVYEGLTSFFGEVLPVRAGAVTPERFRESLAATAAFFEHEAGKRWRSLADTATDAQILYASPAAWQGIRRGVDFYAESVLLWLEIDGQLRNLSGEKLSIDDFTKAFYGGESGSPALKPYVEDDLYSTLNGLIRHDWKRDFRARLDATDGKYFEDALKLSGWRLVYSDKENAQIKDTDARRKIVNRMFSLGFVLTDKAEVRDIDLAGPASAAGMTVGMNVIAVNGRKYSAKILDEAITASRGTSAPIRLLVENVGYYREISVDWHGGAHIPHLERISGVPDRLSLLLSAHAPK